MRVVCPFEPVVHPLTRSALERFTPACEYVALGSNPTAYWSLLDRLWPQRESFVLVEHDVEIHEGVLRALTYCPKPWCVFPYAGPANYGPGGGVLFDQALGCTRFRSSLLVTSPGVISGIDAKSHDWRGLDARVAGALRSLGHRPHVHWPEVLHHHRYPTGCACGREHDT